MQDFSEWQPAGDDSPAWNTPRFDVPQLGLSDASAAEIALAARSSLGVVDSTPDVLFFDQAVAAAGDAEEPSRGQREQAEVNWRLCLGTGDLRAHFGLGYTLLELGRPREAYNHLRYYTEVTANNGWAWVWRGKACSALGEREEAVTCYRRAIKLEERGGYSTDAPGLLSDVELSPGPGLAPGEVAAALHKALDEASGETALFEVAAWVEDEERLTEKHRSDLIKEAQQLIDSERHARGLGDEPDVDDLRAAWAGPPPAPGEEVRQDYPPERGFTVGEGTHMESIVGRTRVIPVVSVDFPDGSSTTLFPSPAIRMGGRQSSGSPD